MQTVQFFVICRKDRWFVGLAGEDYGPFASSDEAVARAIDAARVCVGDGMAARVKLEGRFGFSTIWQGAPAGPSLPSAA